MITHRCLSVSRLLLPTLLALGLCASLAQAAPGVKITSPKAGASISGSVPIIAVTSGITTFNYATLAVDTFGKGLANANPLRFVLDTTRLKNGQHSLQVSISNDAGLCAVSPAVPVMVLNALIGAQPLPAPLPSAAKTATVPASPTKKIGTTMAAQPKLPASPPAVKLTSPLPAQPGISATLPGNSLASTRPAQAAELATPSVALRIAALTAPALPSIMQRPSFNAATKETNTMVTTILLDGKPLVSDYAPIYDNGREMIFLRPLITAVGGNLSWNDEAKQATATLDQHNVIFTIGANTALVDGQSIPLARKVIERHGHLVIPATAWRDLFAGDVGYDEEYCCVWLRSHASLVRAGMAKQ